MNVWHALKRGQ